MKKYIRLLSLSTILLVMASLPARADDPLQVGKAALEKGDLQAAITSLQEAVRKDKKNPQAFFLLGTAYYRADSLDQAVAAGVQARELDSANAAVYSLLGDIYVKTAIHPMAIEQYKHSVAIDSTKPDVYLKLAHSYMKTRQYNEAALAFRSAIKLDTTNIQPFRELGNLYMLAKQYVNAVPFLQWLVVRQPDEAQPQIQLAKALYQTRNYELLIPVANKVIQRDSTQKEVMHMLGVAYVRTRDNPNAEKVLLVLEQRDTLKAEEYVRLAQAQKGLDKVDDAIASYEKAFRADSTLGDIYYDLGTLYMKRKRYEEAVTMFEKKIATDTSSNYQWASHLSAGQLLIQLKDFENARKHLLASIQIKPEYLAGWSNLGICYAQMESTQQEIVTYQKVIELALAANANGEPGKHNKELEEAYRIIGVQYYRDKKYAQAIEYLKKAFQLDPKDCDVLILFAEAYQANDQKDDAIKYYRKVLDTCPKNSTQHTDAIKYLKMLGEFDVEGK